MDELITEIKTLLAAAFTNFTVVYGKVLVPDDTIFPLIEIIPQSTNFNRLGTGGLSDNIFVLKIVYKNSLKKSITQNTNKTTIAHLQDLVKIMEERTAATLQPKSTTILGVLLDNITANNKADILREFNIEYDVTEYAGSWVVKAEMTFEALLKTPIS